MHIHALGRCGKRADLGWRDRRNDAQEFPEVEPESVVSHGVFAQVRIILCASVRSSSRVKTWYALSWRPCFRLMRRRRTSTLLSCIITGFDEVWSSRKCLRTWDNKCYFSSEILLRSRNKPTSKRRRIPYASAGLTVQPEFSDAGKGSVTHFSTRTWILSVFTSSGQ